MKIKCLHESQMMDILSHQYERENVVESGSNRECMECFFFKKKSINRALILSNTKKKSSMILFFFAAVTSREGVLNGKELRSLATAFHLLT